MATGAKGKKGTTASEVQKPAFLGQHDGVSISEMVGGFLVVFDFDRQLAKMLREVPGSEFRRADGVHHVPVGSAIALDKVADAMRAEHKRVQTDLDTIIELAKTSGHKLQRDNNTASGVVPQISSFHEPGKFYGGEIVNANARFVAQSTGFGAKDGAAFVTIHRTADLTHGRLMKGDKVGITYDEKFQGYVTDLSRHKSDAVLEADHKAEQGKTVDGVTVTDRGEKLGVAFDINPVMMARIRRIEGAAFNAADKVWEVPQNKREYALRAVQDMRNEFVLDSKELEMMAGIASDKMDGAKVSKAFTKDGIGHFGTVLAIGERYALQKAGQDKFTLHHVAALNQQPSVGQNLAITYHKGLGAVVDQNLQRAQQQALGTGR